MVEVGHENLNHPELVAGEDAERSPALVGLTRPRSGNMLEGAHDCGAHGNDPAASDFDSRWLPPRLEGTVACSAWS